MGESTMDTHGGAPGQPGTASAPERETDVYTYLRVLYRRRHLAVAALLIPVLAAVSYVVIAPSVYRASVRLQLENRNVRVLPFDEVIAGQPGYGMEFQPTQRDALSSRSLARATIERLDLWDAPEFVDPYVDPIGFVIGPVNRMVSTIRAAIQPSPQSPSRRRRNSAASPESRRESMVISRFLANLRIDAVRNSRVLGVSFDSRDAQLAADVANTLARVYIERDVEFRTGSSRDASEWLQQRIAEQRRHLEANERALQRFREENGAAAIEDRQNMIVDELSNLNELVAAATRLRTQQEARYRDLEAAQDNPEALERFPNVLADNFIREQIQNLTRLRRERVELAEDLGPLHPRIMRIESSIGDAEERLRSELLAVVESARLAYQVARSQEQGLLAEFDRQTAEALALDRTGIEYGVMKREAETSRVVYESLLRRASETSVVGELEASHIRILDEAEVPLGQSSPRTGIVLLTGLMCGIFSAVGLVFLVELLDTTIKTPEDASQYLGVPFLGMIPWAAAPGGRRWGWRRPSGRPDEEPPLLSPSVPAQLAESIRSVRTSLMFSLPGGRLSRAARDQSRAGRRQELGGGQSGDLVRADGPAHAARRSRSPAATPARPLWAGAGARPLEPARRRLGGDRNSPTDRRFRPVAGGGWTGGSESGRPDWIRRVHALPGVVPGALRLDRVRYGAGAAGGRHPDGRQGDRLRAVRRRRRQHATEGGDGSAGAADAVERERRGLRPQQGRRGPPPLLLFALLPARGRTSVPPRLCQRWFFETTPSKKPVEGVWNSCGGLSKAR